MAGPLTPGRERTSVFPGVHGREEGCLHLRVESILRALPGGGAGLCRALYEHGRLIRTRDHQAERGGVAAGERPPGERALPEAAGRPFCQGLLLQGGNGYRTCSSMPYTTACACDALHLERLVRR
jgi:hypothetical protein